jgi:antagonist of KipI
MGSAIEVAHPGWLSLIVDEGRLGHADIGVPLSSVLDSLALLALNRLLENSDDTPAIEVFGTDFSLAFSGDTTAAITGARVRAFLDGAAVEPWATFHAHGGSLLRVAEILEGFRYYVGFAGTMELPRIMGSFSTNVECMFGGFKGRPLMKGDRIGLSGGRRVDGKAVPESYIPDMRPPHVLRVLDGPERDWLTADSFDTWCNVAKNPGYFVSTKSNRTGIRLKGEPVALREEAAGGIVSEGILPGTVQVLPDGEPIIVLFERTMGGYARAGVVASADLDRLAHLKPKDRVLFERVTPDGALRLNIARRDYISSLHKTIVG